MGFDFAKIQRVTQEEKADEDGRHTEVRTKLSPPVVRCFFSPSRHATATPRIPTAQAEVGGGPCFHRVQSPCGYQGSKMFADRNDKLLINNAFVA